MRTRPRRTAWTWRPCRSRWKRCSSSCLPAPKHPPHSLESNRNHRSCRRPWPAGWRRICAKTASRLDAPPARGGSHSHGACAVNSNSFPPQAPSKEGAALLVHRTARRLVLERMRGVCRNDTECRGQSQQHMIRSLPTVHGRQAEMGPERRRTPPDVCSCSHEWRGRERTAFAPCDWHRSGGAREYWRATRCQMHANYSFESRRERRTHWPTKSRGARRIVWFSHQTAALGMRWHRHRLP